VTKYAYFLAEGQQDIEFLSRILKVFYCLNKVKQIDDLDKFWHHLIPSKFPYKGDLLKRVPVPLFLQDSQSEYSIALHSSRGIDRMVEILEENIVLIDGDLLTGVGIFLDADLNEKPEQRHQEFFKKLNSRPNNSPLSSFNKEKVEVFIAPDNETQGTLESILLKLAELNYPDLLILAERYYAAVDKSKLCSKDLREEKKPAGRSKILVSLIASFLKPGKSLSTTLNDNGWIVQGNSSLTEIKKIRDFLDLVLYAD
jgi:hypothetical protein